uniref:Transmembrane protein n=1 Tax=Panagrolaimus sp. ES5 TaxID=591445 RepID=A0AC34G190_9BILA
MLALFAIFLALFGTNSYVSAVDPISCKAVNYTGYFRDSDQFNLTLSGSFVLTNVNASTIFVTASNLRIYNSVINESATGIHYFSILYPTFLGNKNNSKMFVLFALFLAFFGTNSYVSAVDPISCKAVNYTGYFRDSDQFNLTLSGSFVLTNVNASTIFVTASNLRIYNSVINESATGVCYYGICCNISNPNNLCTFDVRDTYILLYANFSTGPVPTTFTGLIADDGTFSTNKLFSPSKMCLSTSSQENTTYTGNTICCTYSVPAPIVQTTNNKRCKQFTSRTTIYNNDFSIFSSSSLIYDVVGRTLYPRNLTDQAATNYFVCYFDHTYFNNPLSCDQKGQVTYSNITMDSGDTKFLISTYYLPYAEIFGINGILSARLLYRNNQLLMQEGVPFTKQNNCLYLKGPWYPSPSNHTTYAQFCCTAFES